MKENTKRNVKKNQIPEETDEVDCDQSFSGDQPFRENRNAKLAAIAS